MDNCTDIKITSAPWPAYIAAFLTFIAIWLAVFLGEVSTANRGFALLYVFFVGALLIYLAGLLWFEGHSVGSWFSLILIIIAFLAVLIPVGLT